MTQTEALAYFDALPAVTTPEMHGHWRGSGIDHRTVFGLMDMRGAAPFFFRLERET